MRAGHHCAQPLMRRLGVAATTRASFHFCNTPAGQARLFILSKIPLGAGPKAGMTPEYTKSIKLLLPRPGLSD